jgi:hypothetical protein
MTSTQDRIIEKATPLLERGERIELACFVAVGSVSYRKEFIRALIIGLITLVLTAGMGYALAMKRPRRAHLALTSRRLLIFDGEASFATSKPGKLLYNIPRQAVSIAKSGNWGLGVLRVELAIAGQDRHLRFTFAPRLRENGHAVIAMLGDQRPRTSGLPRDGYSRQPEQHGGRPRPDSWQAQPRQHQEDSWPQRDRGGYQDRPATSGQQPARDRDDRRQPQRAYQQPAPDWNDRREPQRTYQQSPPDRDDRRQPQRTYQQPARDWDRQPSRQQPTFQPQNQWPAEQAHQARDDRRPGQDRDRRPQPEWDPYHDRSRRQSRDGY